MNPFAPPREPSRTQTERVRRGIRELALGTFFAFLAGITALLLFAGVLTILIKFIIIFID